MHLAGSPAPLATLLRRPDIRLVADGVTIRLDPSLPACGFQVPGPDEVRLGVGVLEADPVRLRHALELALLLRLHPDDPALAGLAAARTATLFLRLERLGHGIACEPPRWAALLDADATPDGATAAGLWAELAAHQPGADPALPDGCQARLTALWPLLGPAEWLMQTGGDARLRLDPETGLNGYGCSPRPRPWALTYASSTASSVSERGYAGAEAARRRLLASPADRSAEADRVRAALRAHYGLPPGTDAVLAASGTDCELFALVLAGLGDGAPLTNVLVAPEETGSGVPLAATGRHFAMDTSRGAAVRKGEVVAGCRDDTRLVPVPLRRADGGVRDAGAVEADCRAAVAAAPGRCLLHLLDVSKTGLLGPDPEALRRLQASLPGRVDVVVDACQGRLSAARVRGYLRAGWMVVVTGSKFFTGPPFAGAVLLPAGMRRRLDGAALPAGLRAYTARPDWPACDAAAGLDDAPNWGMLLRWQAALAEMAAFRAVPDETCHDILAEFTGRARAAIAADPAFAPIEAPAPRRPPLAWTGDWDGINTVIGFALRDPRTGALLDPDAARAVYVWLNADLGPALPGLPPAEAALAAQRCHLGQPVPLPGPDGEPVGVLRLSAGARLVSGEPSHAALDGRRRVEREVADALRVLAKTALILRHRDRLRGAGAGPTHGADPKG